MGIDYVISTFSSRYMNAREPQEQVLGPSGLAGSRGSRSPHVSDLDHEFNLCIVRCCKGLKITPFLVIKYLITEDDYNDFIAGILTAEGLCGAIAYWDRIGAPCNYA